MDSHHVCGASAQFPDHSDDAEPMEVDDWYTTGLPEAHGMEDGELTGLRKEASTKGWQQDTPEHWMKMKPGTVPVAVAVCPNTEEYINVGFSFMSTMTFPDAEVMRICRIQNPFLWKHYVLKHQEMVEENNGMEVLEKHLFHGTKCANIDAICRKGFDWRICGRHGTVYGQGCYFAKDSKYSHKYSPKSCDHRDHCDILSAVVVPDQMGSALGHSVSSPCEARSGIGTVSTHTSPFTLQTDGQVTSSDPGFRTCHPMPAPHGALFQAPSPFPMQSSQFLPGHCMHPPLSASPSPATFQMNSSCSHVTSPPEKPLTTAWPSHLRYMFLARVLVGSMVRGHSDYRRPPAFQPGDPLSKHYDSCVDSTQDPKIFVVFDSNQAYPEYVIEYKCMGKDA